MSARVYILTAIASAVASMAGLALALDERPWSATACIVVALLAASRVFRHEVRAE